MKHIILGTAGHVDHGKTSLVKALTGIDTDRLKEEKERGITIELGFASLSLPSGLFVGIVDVPGHERFIKNMVAGAAGIDLLALVIAADEGVMPQTKEHLAICSLLGITRGVVALTKIDMVDPDWLDLVTDDIRAFLKGTFLEAAPIVPVSSHTGDGLPELLKVLDQTAAQVREKTDTGLFRLPVDRIFTMKGFGTVVTGTLVSGQIKTGEEVEILPSGLKARVRGIQIHNISEEIAEAGQRTAINLQGVDKTAILRGDTLTRPGTLQRTRRLDVRLEYLGTGGKALKNRQLVRFHTGTDEIIARITLFEQDSVETHASVFAQLFLERPTVVLARDHFVIRSYSPVTTIGGGTILDPLTRKHRKNDAHLFEDLQILMEGNDEKRSAVILERAGAGGIRPAELVIRTGIAHNPMRKIVEAMLSRKQAVLIDQEEQRIVSAAIYGKLQEAMVGLVRAYHEKNPLKEGIQKEELRNMAGDFLLPKLFNAALRDLEKRGLLLIDREHVRLPAHQVNLQGEMEDLRAALTDLFAQGGLMPPTKREVMERYPRQTKQVASVLDVMLKEGRLVKVNEDLYYDKNTLDKLRGDYKSLLIKEGKATPVTFKELTGLTRKFIIPLMEYFDVTKLTIRTGDFRILRTKP
ncbi:MAG: Selenocysteine-specific elongation factor [Syntrophus sp. SKADARSKE-3]|nr:Selenocysteine-specific elongation factor [Syntrophus sp. SKADARSKE-3]